MPTGIICKEAIHSSGDWTTISCSGTVIAQDTVLTSTTILAPFLAEPLRDDSILLPDSQLEVYLDNQWWNATLVRHICVEAVGQELAQLNLDVGYEEVRPGPGPTLRSVLGWLSLLRVPGLPATPLPLSPVTVHKGVAP